ncbi:hypothetical protein H3C61_01120 [Candidatus Gracilibacteria bacterium]|nr:hypothetical protein [Candidatus Gracilibacteria bacterium]
MGFFDTLKTNALKAKDKAVELKNKGVDFTANQISKSSLMIKDTTELEAFILKSANKTITKEDGEEKTFIKRVIVLVGDSKENFLKEIMLSIPVLLTKSFSQSVQLKIIDSFEKKVDLEKYNLESFPCLIVFENKEIYKIISGEENIKKVVNSLSLDINKEIEEI